MRNLDATGAVPLDVKFIECDYRICLVVAMSDGNGGYDTKLRWHTPKTKKHRKIVNNFIAKQKVAL